MSAGIKIHKRILRKVYLDRRKSLSDSWALLQSKKIAQKLLSLPEIKGKNNFSIYLPINKEVYTTLIIETLAKREANIFLPCYSQKLGYFLGQFDNWEELEEGPYGILQPKNNLPIDPLKLEVAILPGVAFSRQGLRLGYGKGVFDRLLTKSAVFKIGLAFDFQVVEDLPRDGHDIVVDLVVTEKKVYRV